VTGFRRRGTASRWDPLHRHSGDKARRGDLVGGRTRTAGRTGTCYLDPETEKTRVDFGARARGGFLRGERRPVHSSGQPPEERPDVNLSGFPVSPHGANAGGCTGVWRGTATRSTRIRISMRRRGFAFHPGWAGALRDDVQKVAGWTSCSDGPTWSRCELLPAHGSPQLAFYPGEGSSRRNKIW